MCTTETNKIARKTAAAAASTFRRGNEDPYDSDSDPASYLLSILCRTGSRPDSPRSVQPMLWSTVTLCGRPARYLASRTTADVHIIESHGPAGRPGHPDICNSLQRLSMQQRIRDTLRRTRHSRYLLVLGWTTIHPLPSNHLRYYSRRSLWTGILRESPVETLWSKAYISHQRRIQLCLSYR